MLPVTPQATLGSQPTPEQTELRRLAANLAHNINNPLTGVIGCLELALQEAPADSRLHHQLEQSLNCSLRVAEMVRRVVAFAFRPTSQRQTAFVSLRQLGEELVRSLRENEPKSRLYIRLLSDSDGLIRASTPLLVMVLDQIVSNALEAMDEDGEIIIRVWDEGTQRKLSIADSGDGLLPDAQEYLFEPFYTTKCSGHLGLGLALSKEVITALGGSIEITSIRRQGTTVTLSFPAVEQSQLDDLPIDERIGVLASSCLNRYSGPHFSPRTAPSQTTPLQPSYTI